jgi:hypothetical protein
LDDVEVAVASSFDNTVVLVTGASFTKGVPLGRMGTVEKVARWIVAAADPAAAGVTGHVLSIDGGVSLT